MFECRKVRGLIAAALYEPLAPAEQARLEAHLGRCAVCRREAESLGALVRKISTPPADFQGDLLPAIREQLSANEYRRTGYSWRWAVPLAAMLVLGLSVVAGVRLAPSGTAPQMVKVEASPVEMTLVEARKAMKSDFAGARGLLQRALAEYPEDARAGDAQQLLAELEFSHGQRYKEAYAAYETLRTRYNSTFAANPESVFRLNLLDEARAADFEPLYAFDTARSSTGDAVKQLEKVVSRYPGTLVASLGVNAMVDTLVQESPGDAQTRAAALETLRGRCTDPMAAAQVNLALGSLYWEQMHDAEKARPVYAAVADSPHAILAQLARRALSEIDSTPQR